MHSRHTRIDSPLGKLTLTANGDALTGVYFPHHWHPPTAQALGEYVEPMDHQLFRRAGEQLHEYLAGERKGFDLPLAPVGDPRQLRIWDLLDRIGYGQTKTYGELAAELADGTTAIEVGQGFGRNPLSVV